MMKENFAPVPESLYTCGTSKYQNFEQIYTMLAQQYENIQHHPMSKLQRNLVIRFYPCHFDVLMDNRKKISKSVKFLPGILSKAKTRLHESLQRKKLEQKGGLLISVHVRRTDYIYLLKSYNRSYLSVCYYEQAMHYFRQRFNNPTFVMTSDDITWCKSFFHHTDIVFLEHDDSIPPVVDLATMTLCDHHIIGFGAFGFLGAFLGGKGLIVHSIVFDSEIEDNEFELLCSDSQDLIPIADIH